MTAFNSPLYLWLDSKTETYPNPTAGLKSRTTRSSNFHFQTYGCDYFVDVRVNHADSPEATRHEVIIRISDFVGVNADGEDRTKETNFLPVVDGQNPSVADARRLANIHLANHLITA